MLVVKYYDYDSDKDLFEMHVEICMEIFSTGNTLVLETNVGDKHNIVKLIPHTRIISISVKE